jgi:hypothetical protein
MPKLSLPRILIVTIGLAIAGTVIGAVLGGLLVTLMALRAPSVHVDAGVFVIGAYFGGAMGTVLAPVAAWLLIHDVPLWRAIAETAAGTVIGVATGIILEPLKIGLLSPPLLGVAGFAAAALRVRLMKRRRVNAGAPTERSPVG